MIESALSVLETEEQRNELSDFYENRKSILYSIAKKYIHSDTDAEDVVQEVFLAIADKPDRFFSLTHSERIKYVNVITRNIAFDSFNKAKKISLEEIDENILNSNISLEDSILELDSANKIKDFIKGLPANQRDVIFLHCVLELTLDETAQKMNISVSTVKKYLFNGRKAIREYIDRSDNND